MSHCEQAGKGNVIGGNFQDLADIISLIDNKNRVGVTLDTCHAFAWVGCFLMSDGGNTDRALCDQGYDLRTPPTVQDTLNAFDSAVGLSYLKALHVSLVRLLQCRL